jgi:peroxiredoxin
VQSKGVQIVGIGIDSPSNIKEFLQKYEISYPIMVAGMEGTDLSRQLGNKSGALPFTLLIDRNGKVAKTYLGRLKMKNCILISPNFLQKNQSNTFFLAIFIY